MSEFHVLISRWWRGEWDDESRTERDAHKMETVHLIGFFFSLFPPPRSIRWTVFLIVDRGNFHEVISLFSDRSDLCVYTLINLPDERVVNVVQSTKHRSRTSNSFQYWINGYILPTVCHQATTKRTKEKKKKKKEAIIISASAVAHSLKKGKNKKGKKNHGPGACLAVRGRVNIDSHTITRERGAPHPACERAIGSPIDSVIAFFSYSNLTVFFFFFFFRFFHSFVLS